MDEDWIARFFELAKDVSREEMQKLWGRLLAGEISKPGQFSLRTLEVLRNLSAEEAKLFERACAYVLSKYYIVDESNVFKDSSGLNQSEIIKLSECQLLIVIPGLSITFPSDTMATSSSSTSNTAA